MKASIFDSLGVVPWDMDLKELPPPHAHPVLKLCETTLKCFGRAAC